MSPTAPPGPDASFGPEFDAVEPLGHGAFAEVYRARDALRRDLAIKVLTPLAARNPADTWRFRDEYRRLATLTHPGFTQAHGEGRTADGRPYYVMAYAAGVAPVGPWAPAQVRAALAFLTDALADLHARGWVHGDLKPANLRVDDAGRWHLLDVGLLAPIGRRREAIAGTLEYLAPEAWRRAPVDPALDMYALGILAYELWHGELPYRLDPPTPVAWLRAHLTTPAPRAPQAAADPALADWLGRMISKVPQDRPSAAELRSLLAGERPAGSRPAALMQAPLVGREEVLQTFAALQGEGGGALALVGDSGSGKSRVLEELRLAATLSGWAWAEVGGLGGDQAPDAAARALVRQALAAAGHAAVDAVADWLIGRPIAAFEGLEPRAARFGILSAIVEALAAAATATGGLALGVDDAHLLDAGSTEFLALLRREPPPAPVLLVVTADAPAPDWCDRVLPLLPLDRPSLAAYVTGRLGQAAPAGLLDQAAQACAGNLGALTARLEVWLVAGALRVEPAGWAFDGALAATAARATRAWDLGVLGATAQRLAGVAAVARLAGPLAPAQLALAADLTTEAAADAADALLAEGWLVELAGRWRLASAEAEAAALTGIPQATRAAWANALVRAFWADGGDAEGAGPGGTVAPESWTPATFAGWPVDALATFATLAIAGTDDALTAAAAAAAGHRLLALGAPARALTYFDEAKRRSPAGAAVPAAVSLGRAEAARQLDRNAEATPDYEAAIAQAAADGDTRTEAIAAYGLAKCCQLAGDYDGAERWFKQAEARTAATTDAGWRARIALGQARVAHFRGDATLALAYAQAAARIAEAAPPAFRAQALNLVGALTAMNDPGQAAAGLATLASALALAEGAGDRLGAGFVLDNIGNANMARGEARAAAEAFHRFGTISRAAGSATEALSADLNEAIALGDLGETAAAHLLAIHVSRRAAEAGRQFPLAAALTVLGQAAWRDGRPLAVFAALDEALSIALKISNRHLEEHVRLVRLEAWLAFGDLPRAREEVERLGALLGDRGTSPERLRLAAGEAELARQAGDPRLADRVAAELTATPHVAVRRDAHRVLARLALAAGDGAAAQRHATAARGLAAAWHAPWLQAADDALLASAAAAVGDASACEAWALAAQAGPNPYARLSAALALAAAGPPEARAETLAHAVAQARSLFGDLTPARRAALIGAQALQALWDAPAAADGIAPATALIGWAEAIARADGEAAITAAVLAAVRTLAQAERGFVLAYEGGRMRRALTAGMGPTGDIDAFSHTLAEHTLLSAEPLYVPDAAEAPAWREAESVIALGLRTVVCLPLATPSAILGVVYVDRQAPEPPLTPADLAGLHLLAIHAASALAAARDKGQAQVDAARQALLAALGARLARGADGAAVRSEALRAGLSATGAERAFWIVPADDGWSGLAGLDATGQPLAFAPAQVSQGVLDWVAERGEALELLDLGETESWRARESVAALALRTVWCLPVGTPDGALLYLDATLPPEAAPEVGLHTLGAIAAYAAGLLAG